jgi:hypothetical protein
MSNPSFANSSKKEKTAPEKVSKKTNSRTPLPYVKPVKEKKIDPIAQTDIKYRNDSKTVKYEPVVITISAASLMTPSEIVIHHPVGKHKLLQSDWVASSKSDFATLLRNEVDPRKPEKERGARKNGYAALVGIIDDVKIDNGQVLIRGIDLDTLEELPKTHTSYKAATEFLKELRSHDQYKEKYWDTMESYPQFETMKGPNLSMPQTALTQFKGLKQQDVINDILRSIATAKGESKEIHSPLDADISAAFPVAPKEEEEEKEKPVDKIDKAFQNVGNSQNASSGSNQQEQKEGLHNDSGGTGKPGPNPSGKPKGNASGNKPPDASVPKAKKGFLGKAKSAQKAVSSDKE